jgi:predicted nucleic acid-binding protein
MLLVDTSVWVHHFRQGEPRLQQVLEDGMALTHPFVVGELACGNLKNRDTILNYLRALAEAERAVDSEVRRLIETRRLWGRGLGWLDMHLLASALLSHCGLWTLDKALAETAKELGLPA